ncbi:MAG: mandelate racemase [Burkholderiaceae bacterium]|nr:mandelate racemase [Burkholderiaceae bacterium]MBP7658706.1 mandelate racemase [Burkholderiaceae bacterium]
MSDTRIARIRATPVTVPLQAPLRHSNGAHWGRFVRTIVEVETDDGYVGLGEFGGGGEAATQSAEDLISYLKGHDVFRLEALRFAICNPTASLYNNRTQVHAAIEFACLDIIGQKLGIPVSEFLGGRLRDQVEFASYLFFRYPGPAAPEREERTPEQLVAHALELKAQHGFRAHKLKGGVYPPRHELACYQALAAALPGDRLRYDPNCALSLGDAIEFGRAIEGLNNDYFEDPVFGMPQLARLREFVRIPTATNTVVVNFEQLAANVAQRAVDVILLDTTFWGGIRPCIKAAAICDTFGLGVAVHSSGELGIQLATMLHMGAVVPNLGYAADAHYHHLLDDVIVGGKMRYQDGAIAVPTGAGLGVRLDRDKLRQYHELFRELGGYAYDRDPGRPGWYPLVPNDRWADPSGALPLAPG